MIEIRDEELGILLIPETESEAKKAAEFNNKKIDFIETESKGLKLNEESTEQEELEKELDDLINLIDKEYEQGKDSTS